VRYGGQFNAALPGYTWPETCHFHLPMREVQRTPSGSSDRMFIYFRTWPAGSETMQLVTQPASD
jgi:hypothetical protein